MKLSGDKLFLGAAVLVFCLIAGSYVMRKTVRPQSFSGSVAVQPARLIIQTPAQKEPAALSANVRPKVNAAAKPISAEPGQDVEFVEQRFKEFGFTGKPAEEIIEAAKQKQEADEDSLQSLDAKELQVAKLAPYQISRVTNARQVNLRSGFEVSAPAAKAVPGPAAVAVQPEKLTEEAAAPAVAESSSRDLINSCSPNAEDGQQVLVQKSSSLAALGFSWLLAGETGLAEAAFRQVLSDYPAGEEAGMVYLELARLLRDTDRKDEALATIEKATGIYRDDQEFVFLAQTLKKAIAP